jgi:hypothetical protein
MGYENIAFVNIKGKTKLALLEKNENGEDIIKAIVSSKEFDEIKSIILNQNDAYYDNRYISLEIKKKYNHIII